VDTFTIPQDEEFYIKVGKSFLLAFNEEGDLQHNDSDHFDPKLINGHVDSQTPVQPYKALKEGKVKIEFTPSKKDDGSSHTILIGN
jgi:hypothetical protein